MIVYPVMLCSRDLEYHRTLMAISTSKRGAKEAAHQLMKQVGGTFNPVKAERDREIIAWARPNDSDCKKVIIERRVTV